MQLYQGTGSYPPDENGLHLKILPIASKIPFKGPCLQVDYNAYVEQVG